MNGVGTVEREDLRVATFLDAFDQAGEYIRRYVPELADVPSRHLHQPWQAPDGPPKGYPGPIVDHATERKEALDRYATIKR